MCVYIYHDYLQGRVVAWSQKLLAHNQVGLGVGVELLDIVEDLGRTLAGTNDSDAVRLVLLGEDVGHVVGELRGVEDARVGGGEALGDRGLAARGHEDVSGAEGPKLAVTSGLDGEALDAAAGGSGGGGDGDDLVVVLHDVVKEGRAPAQVVLVLASSRQEGAQVGEVDQAIVAMEVVEEGELGARIAQGRHILDEGDLHLGTREQHAGVPRELGLLLEEENLGRSTIGPEFPASSNGIVHGNSHGKTGRAKAGADEIILGARVRSLKVLRAFTVHLAPVPGSGGNLRAAGATGAVRAIDTLRGHCECVEV